MSSIITFLIFSPILVAFACIPTSPGGSVRVPGTPPPPAKCCPIGIFDEKSTGMAVFDPALRECPSTAQLICSVAVVGNKDPTTIVINGATEVARGPSGTNTKITLTCRKADTTWLLNYNNQDVAVKSITCNNNAL